jgi:cytochrome c oxidase assembly protein subunit 15
LLALLVGQAVRMEQVRGVQFPASVGRGQKWWMVAAMVVLCIQAALGAWVSTNYAVLACSEFPKCQGSWWPPMDFAGGFELWRPLGLGQDGAHTSFQSLTAIHYAHRMFAAVAVLVLGGLVWHLRSVPALRAQSRWLGALLALQLATGLSNVVLDWPLVAAVLHTGGAGAMVVVLTWLLVGTRTPSSLVSRTRTRTEGARLPEPRFSE